LSSLLRLQARIRVGVIVGPPALLVRDAFPFPLWLNTLDDRSWDLEGLINASAFLISIHEFPIYGSGCSAKHVDYMRREKCIRLDSIAGRVTRVASRARANPNPNDNKFVDRSSAYVVRKNQDITDEMTTIPTWVYQRTFSACAAASANAEWLATLTYDTTTVPDKPRNTGDNSSRLM
jgi:hypothetical protein